MINKKFKLICASLAAIFLLTFTACSSNNKKTDESTTKPKTEEQKEDKKQEENNTDKKDNKKEEVKELKVGDTFEQDDFKVTINKVREVKPTNDFLKPSEGDKWVAVDVTIENIGNEDATISSALGFKLLDKDGRNFDMAIVTDLNGSLNGTLAAGRKMTGETAFSVPVDTQEVELEVKLKLGGKPNYVKATIEQ